MKQFLIVLTLLLLSATGAMALDPVNETWAGVAIKGYDPVAYFTESKPIKGSSDFTHEWNDASWSFSSEKNRDRFAADPKRYAPQYGGYCAWAVSRNDTAGIDPAAWKIVDDKLYLNYSKKIQEKWAGDIPANIAAADANWPGLIGNE